MATDIAQLAMSVDSRGVVTADKRLERLERQSRKTEKASEKMGRRFEKAASAAKKLAAAAAAVSAAAGFAVKQFADFETALVGVAKVSDLSSQEIEKMGRQIRFMSTQMPFAATELAALAEAAGRLGVTGSADILKFTETVAKLGTASDISGEEAATALARVLNVSNEANSRVDILASTIVALGNSFAASESEITLMTTEIARGISTFDVASEKSAALAGVLASLGVRMQEAGSGVGRTFRSIEAAIGEGGDEFERLQQITQMTGDQLRATFEEDSVAVFQAFIEGLQRVQESGGRVAGVLDKFGLAGERIAKVIPVLAGRSDELARALRTAASEAEDATALEDEYQRALDTTGTELTLLKNVLIEQARILGGTLAPSVRRASEAIREFVTALQNGKDSLNGFTEGVKDVIFAVDQLLELGGDFGSFQIGADPDEAVLDLTELIGQTNEFINSVNPAVIAGNKFTETLRSARKEAEQTQGLETFANLVGQIQTEFSKSDEAKDAVDGLVGSLKKLFKETEDVVEVTEEAAEVTGELERVFVDVSDKVTTVAEDYEELVDQYIDLIGRANPAIKTLADMAKAQEEINEAQEAGFTITERQTQAILNQAAGLSAWASEQELVNRLLIDAGVPEETLDTWREMVDLMSRAAGLGPKMSRIGAPEQAQDVGRSDDFDRAIGEAANVAVGAVSQQLGIDQGGIGAGLGGIAGSFIPGLPPGVGSAIGSLLGGFIDDLFGSGSPDFPSFNVQSSQPSFSELDQSRDTPFGGVSTGTVFNMDAGQIREILDAVVSFDRELSQIFDPSDFDAISASLSAFNETFQESGANAEEVMRRRFIAALDAAEPEIAAFVEEFGSLEDMKGALEGIFDVRESIEDFDNVVLSLGSDVDKLNARLNRMQTGIEEADTAMEQALFSEDPQAIAEAGRNLQQAILEKFEFEKRLVEQLQDSLRSLEISSRDFSLDVEQRIAEITGDFAQVASVAAQNLREAREDIVSAPDAQAGLQSVNRFISRISDWLDAATQRIQSEISALESEANEILSRGRERAQAAAELAQRSAQAAQRARQRQLEAIQEQISASQEWLGVLKQAEDLIDNLRFSQVSPASGFSRLEDLSREISAIGTPSSASEASELVDLLNRRIQLGQQQFQRPSGEFQALFNETMRALSEVEDQARSHEEIIEELQREANALQQLTAGGISSRSRDAIRLSAQEQRRLEEIREEQDLLREEQEQVNQEAAQFYRWAQSQRAELEAQRHAEIRDQLNAITGGLDPESFIAQREEETVDRLTSIRDMMQDFLSSITQQAGGGFVPPEEPGPRPGFPIPQSGGGEKTVNMNINVKGGSKRDTDRIVTHIKRELKTA